MHTQTHTTLGGTLNPSHLSTDSSAQSAHPYIKVACALLLPAASHKPQSSVLRPGLLHAALHISLQLLYQSALSTLISILSEEQRRNIQRRRKTKYQAFLFSIGCISRDGRWNLFCINFEVQVLSYECSNYGTYVLILHCVVYEHRCCMSMCVQICAKEVYQ